MVFAKKIYDNCEELKSTLLALLANKLNSEEKEAILQGAGVGRRRFLEKFEDLLD